MKKAYYGNINPYFQNKIIFWGASKYAKDIFSLQKNAIKTMFNLKRFESCKETYLAQKILTVPCLYILESVKFVKNNIGNFQSNADIHTHNTRRKNDPRPSKNPKDLRSALINLYNKLPSSIKDIEKPHLFKNAVKKLLYTHQFYSISEYYQTNL